MPHKRKSKGDLNLLDPANWTPVNAATIDRVPNQPKTPISSFRIPTPLKSRVAAKAKKNGTDLTAIVVKAFEDYDKEEDAG